MYLVVHDETIRLDNLTLDYTVGVYTDSSKIVGDMWLKVCDVDDMYISTKEEYTLPTNVATGSIFTLLYLKIATRVEKEYPKLIEPLRNLMQKSAFRQW